MSNSCLSPALTQALQAGRSQFNARVAEACRAQPGFDTGALQSFVSGPLDALAVQAQVQDAARANALIMAAFDCALTLQLRGKGELPLVQAIWQTLVPACLPLAMQQPRDTFGSLFNAALNLQTVNGARPQQWLQEMTRLAGHCADLAALRGLGQVLAWRCGAAHFRISALAVLKCLPASLAMAAFPVPQGQSWPVLLARLQQDPWFDPTQPAAQGLRATHEIGGFTGFGGPFATSPEVRSYADGFVLRSADRYWYLCADAFGAVLHAASAEEFAAGERSSGTLQLHGNVVRHGGQSCALDLPADGLGVVCGPFTAVLSSPHSHFIRLLALK